MIRALLIGAAATVALGAQAANPIVKGWYADPEIRIFGDTYWIYPTYSADLGTPARPSVFTPEQQRMRARSDLVWAPFLKQTFLDAFSSPTS